MSEHQSVFPASFELSPEDEERFEALAETVSDTIEGLEDLLAPGDRFAINPASFAEAEEFEEDEEKMGQVLRVLAFRALGFDPANLEVIRQEGSEKWFQTSNPTILVGTDGGDWWLEVVAESSDDAEPEVIRETRAATSKKVRKSAVPAKEKKSGRKQAAPKKKPDAKRKRS